MAMSKPSNLILTFIRLSNHKTPNITKRIPITFTEYEKELAIEHRLFINLHTRIQIVNDPLVGTIHPIPIYHIGANCTKNMLTVLSRMLSERSTGMDNLILIYEHFNKGFSYFQLEGLDKA